jgi:hypothetical protein
MLSDLLAQKLITQAEADLAARVPVAEDITVEADSGGHTDNQLLVAKDIADQMSDGSEVAEQFVVVCVRADEEPDDHVVIASDADRSVGVTDSDRPKGQLGAKSFKPEAGMTGILHESPVSLPRSVLNGSG